VTEAIAGTSGRLARSLQWIASAEAESLRTRSFDFRDRTREDRQELNVLPCSYGLCPNTGAVQAIFWNQRSTPLPPDTTVRSSSGSGTL
jgi:hypothetical protein